MLSKEIYLEDILRENISRFRSPVKRQFHHYVGVQFFLRRFCAIELPFHYYISVSLHNLGCFFYTITTVLYLG